MTTQLLTTVMSLKGKPPHQKPIVDDGIVPSYLQGGYHRASAADELAANYLADRQALGALLHSALTDPERLVRDRCIRALVESKCDDLDVMLVAFTFDPDEEIRLLALEALAVAGYAVLRSVSERMQGDSDENVSGLAAKLLACEEWCRYMI